MNTLHYRLKHKLDEVYSIEPNSLGNTLLTKIFKLVTSFLKVMPFIYIIPLCIFVSALLYLTLGHLIIKLVTLLQYGF